MEICNMINSSLILASVLIFGIGVVHSWLGERRLIGPLLAPDKRRGMLEKSRFARQTLRFAWHLTTLAWWGLGAVLIALAMSPLDGHVYSVSVIIGATFLITGLVTLLTSRGRHLAWPVFLAIAGLSVYPLV